MKAYVASLIGFLLILSLYSCDRSGNGSGKIDSIAIARAIAERYPDSIPALKNCINKNFGFTSKDDKSWIFDTSRANYVQGPNYFLAINKTLEPANIKSGINSDEGKAMVSNFEMKTTALKGLRSFSVEFEKDEFLTYLANIEAIISRLDPSNHVTNFRVYWGAYPIPYTPKPANEGRFTGILVAVDNNKQERYFDTVDGCKVVNLGTMCPTNCPASADKNSLFTLAGLRNPDQ